MLDLKRGAIFAFLQVPHCSIQYIIFFVALLGAAVKKFYVSAHGGVNSGDFARIWPTSGWRISAKGYYWKIASGSRV